MDDFLGMAIKISMVGICCCILAGSYRLLFFVGMAVLSLMTTESMFPEYPDTHRLPFEFDPATIKVAVAHPKPDNSAYLAAMREFRERYEQAERDMGAPVEIAELVFRRKL